MMSGHMRYLVYNGCRGGTMKATVEQIGLEREEELTVRCHDPARVSVGQDRSCCRSTDDFP